MEFKMPTGEKSEKTGTVMTNVQTATPNNYEEINRKLDRILKIQTAAAAAETEVKKNEYTDFSQD